MKSRGLGLSLLILLSVAGMGCNRTHVVNSPPGVVDTEVALWFQATGAVRTWADTSLQLIQASVALHSSPEGPVFPDDATYTKTLQALGKENQLGLQATEFLQTVPQHFDSVSQQQLGNYLDQGMAMLSDATSVGLLQIKDPAKKAAIGIALESFRASLRTIFALVKPAGTPVPLALQGVK